MAPQIWNTTVPLPGAMAAEVSMEMYEPLAENRRLALCHAFRRCCKASCLCVHEPVFRSYCSSDLSVILSVCFRVLRLLRNQRITCILLDLL